MTELSGQSVNDAASDEVQWTIDNKYYTAKVSIKLVNEGLKDLDAAPVHLVVLPQTGLPTSILTQIRDAQPEMAFALQLTARAESADEIMGALEEYSLDLIDVTTDRADAVEELRQSLQTHMWPSMVMKPKPELQAPRRASVNAVASSSKVRAQADHDFGDFEGSAQGEVVDASAWTSLRFEQDELQQLDAWLDSDGHSSSAQAFEDDYTGAMVLQDDDLLPIDPGPLLQPLEATRAQLADVADEDERRVMAANEVERLFKSLGIDLDLDDEDLMPART